MIGYPFIIKNKKGQFIKINDFNTDPNNFIALQDYPIFDVDIKQEEIDKEGQHGVWDFYSFYGKRVITLSGVIIGENEGKVEELKRKLLQVVSLPAQPEIGNDGLVFLEWKDAKGDEWIIQVKIERDIRFDRRIKFPNNLSFIMTIKAPDPVIESKEIVEATSFRSWLTGSLRLPTKLPAKFNLIYQNKIIVENKGNFTAYAIIRLYGEDGGITNPEIWNMTNGKRFKILTVLNSNEWIEINTKEGSVRDQDGNDKSGLIDPLSEYIFIESGINELVYLSEESWGATNPIVTWKYPQSQVVVKFRHSII